ncbi:MAG: amidophosphoribosyltransferase [Candidatus Methanofastidiosia archaeon]
MCGVIGLSSDNVAWEAYRGLLSIQHRGQNSAGIVTLNNKFYRKQGNGLVSKVFENFELDELKGNIGIAHVRYPTSGNGPVSESQPLFINYPYGLALSHNGNLTNYKELKQFLHDKRRSLQTESDTEVLLNLLAHQISKHDIDTALEHTMNNAEGSYSAAMLLCKNEGKMIAFRDPNGIRPLIIGKRETETGCNYIVCSESVGLDVNGYEQIRDVKAGEAVSFSRDEIEFKQIRPARPAHCMFEYVYFSRPDSIIEGKSVYEVRFKLGENIEFYKDVDTVIPVPDTSRTAALGFALKYNLPYREGLIKNRYIGRTFIMPTQPYRESAVIEKLNVIKKEVSGKRIALVDDSIVRGTTSKRLVNLLRNNGAKEVHFISSCPPIKYPCFYGIDMTIKDELIASNYIKDIKNKIGADSVTYQSIEGLVKSIGLPKSHMCLACLNGDYPTGITCEKAEVLGKNREKERKNWKGIRSK